MKKINFKKVKYFLTIFFIGIVISGFAGCSQSKDLFIKEGFHRTGDMIVPRAHHTATLLQDGRVLIAGGNHYKPKAPSAEVYDPKTGKFTVTGNMNIPRAWHTATLLNDGRVLIVGGAKMTSPGGFIKEAEIYNPKTDKFTLVGDMSKAKTNLAAILLNDGNVLIVGWVSADIFDPKINKFSSINLPKEILLDDYRTLTLVKDGNVLILSGGTSMKKSNAVYLFKSKTNEFKHVGNLLEARINDKSILLPGGKVLVIGGIGNTAYLKSVELYDSITNKSIYVSNMNKIRGAFTATLLNNNKILIAGGTGKTAYMSAEIYDSKINKFKFIQTALPSRYEHTATLLKDGSVLITGGQTRAEYLKNSVRYYPAKK